MTRRLLIILLAVVLTIAAAPARASYQPVPYDPLPTSYEQLPLGPATSFPWWQAGVLHLGATTIRTRYRDIVSRNGTTVLGSGWSSPGRRSTAVLVNGVRLVGLPIAGHIRGPEVSADGHWVAWLDEREHPLAEDLDLVRYRLVLYDARSRKLAADWRETRRVEHEDGENGLRLVSVADTGQVVFERGHAGPHVLGPRGKPVRLKGKVRQLRDWDGWPLGLTFFKAVSDRGYFGTVSRRGRFHRVGTTSLDYGVWSPAGDGFAMERQGVLRSTYWVDRPGAGTTVQLGLPEDRPSLSVLGWESATSVLLLDRDEYADPAYSTLLRCAAETGDCQRVDAGPGPDRPAVFARW